MDGNGPALNDLSNSLMQYCNTFDRQGYISACDIHLAPFLKKRTRKHKEYGAKAIKMILLFRHDIDILDILGTFSDVQ